jgi:hypothetical protein
MFMFSSKVISEGDAGVYPLKIIESYLRMD